MKKMMISGMLGVVCLTLGACGETQTDVPEVIFINGSGRKYKYS